MTDQVQRFRLALTDNAGGIAPVAEPHTDGPWVHYSDYEKARREGAEEERERLREVLRERAEWERAKKTVKTAWRAIALEEARAALDTPTPSEPDGSCEQCGEERCGGECMDAPLEPETHHPDCSSHTTRWCDCKGLPTEVSGPSEEENDDA